MARNITEVRLLNVPLENDYLHTLYFGSKAAQESYFKSCTIANGVNTDFSYQRKDNVIRWCYDVDSIIGANYVMYKNSSYTDKWYYAFITSMDYINDGRTDIHIETDVIQTWLFDYTVKHSFVEREHVNDDTIGLHTVDEQLELGEFVVNETIKFGSSEELNEFYYVLGTTADPATGEDLTGGGKYNGIYSGVKYYRYKDSAGINAALKKLAEEGKVDSITGLFLAPWTVCAGAGDDNAIPETNTPSTITSPIDKSYNLNGYTPKNNKMKCYPFNYIGVSNNNGGCAVYRYEDFSTTTCSLSIYESLCPGISTKLIPLNYKGVELNHDEGLTGGKYPICNYAVDMYTNWLTQNSVNNGISFVSGLGTAMVGIGSVALTPATGGASLMGAGAIAGGISQMINTVARSHEASFMPNQARGNTNSGDVITSMGDNCFFIYKMSVKKEYARICDNFLSMFGYKVTVSKVPNKNHRENYWYTKLIDANITGAIPMNDLQKIKAVYNRGVTFWRNAANIKNYSVSNEIV